MNNKNFKLSSYLDILMHKNSRCSRCSSIFRSKWEKEKETEKDRENYKRGKERETTANSTKIKRKSGEPIFVQKRKKKKGEKR